MRFVIAAAMLLSVTVMPLSAHHGWGGQQSQEFELTGVLVEDVNLSGPHGTMKIRAANNQVWDITLAPSARTSSAGLRAKVIPMGATVTVHGHRNSNAQRFEVKTERVTWNGRTFNVYPDRT